MAGQKNLMIKQQINVLVYLGARVRILISCAISLSFQELVA